MNNSTVSTALSAMRRAQLQADTNASITGRERRAFLLLPDHLGSNLNPGLNGGGPSTAAQCEVAR